VRKAVAASIRPIRRLGEIMIDIVVLDGVASDLAKFHYTVACSTGF